LKMNPSSASPWLRIANERRESTYVAFHPPGIPVRHASACGAPTRGMPLQLHHPRRALSMDRARAPHLQRPAPTPAERPPGVVVPLYNEHDLAHSLAPWADLTRRQQQAKAWLVLTDLSVLALCFLAGRLPAWLRDEISLAQAMNVWWAANGHLRITL